MAHRGAVAPKRRKVVARAVEVEGDPFRGNTAPALKTTAKSVTVGNKEVTVDSVLPISASLEEAFKATGRPLLESTMDGTNTALMMYGNIASQKRADLLGLEPSSMLQQVAYAMFDGAARLQDAMDSVFTYQISMVDIHGEEVYDLGLGFPGAAARPVSAGSNVASVVMSEPSATGLVSSPEHKEATEEELARFRGSTLELKQSGEGYEAKKLTIKSVNSKEDMLTHVAAALAFRDACAPYDPDTAHTILKIYSTREVPAKVLPEPIAASAHLVDLACEDYASTPETMKGQAERLSKDFKALSTVLSGSAQAKAAVNDSSLTKFLGGSLMGTSETVLVANVTPQGGAPTMEFAKSCMALETRTAASSRPGSDFVVVDHEGVVAKMARENAHLRHQLKETNAHYQQLLMTHAPHAIPHGVVEREDGLSGFEDALHVDAPSDEDDDDAPGAPPVAAAAASSMPKPGLDRPPSTASSRAMSTIRSVTSFKSTGKASAATRALEAKVKDLEEQLERQKHRNGVLEGQVGELKEQITEVKDGRMQADHLHYKQSKKLTEQAKLLTEQGNAKEEQMKFQLNSEREAAAERLQTLKEENGTLRREFSNIMQSIPRFIETRTKEVADEKDFRKTIRAEARDDLKRQVETAESNASRQVANLRAQSEYLLNQKNKQIERLTAEAAAAAEVAAAEATSLKQELEYVYEYSNRLAKIVENVEAGKYSIKALKGKKVYQIPNHSKPVPLNMDRLAYLSEKMAQTAKFTETTYPGDGEDSNPGSPRGEGTKSARTDDDDDAPAVGPASTPFTELTEAHKREIEAKVMSELSSDETVQYIRTLEADRQLYRKELHSERKKMHDLRVALSSMQRVASPNPWTTALAAGTRDYRNLSTSAKITFPSNWGNPLGITDSSGATGSRPGTAPEHLKTLQRPTMVSRATTPGTYSMKLAGSTFGYRNQMGGAATNASSKFSLPPPGKAR